MEDILNINEELNEVDMAEMVIPRNPKVYLNRINTDAQFRSRYRMRKQVARRIMNLIHNEIGNYINYRGSPITPEIQVLATIRYLAKGA